MKTLVGAIHCWVDTMRPTTSIVSQNINNGRMYGRLGIECLGIKCIITCDGQQPSLSPPKIRFDFYSQRRIRPVCLISRMPIRVLILPHWFHTSFLHSFTDLPSGLVCLCFAIFVETRSNTNCSWHTLKQTFLLYISHLDLIPFSPFRAQTKSNAA